MQALLCSCEPAKKYSTIKRMVFINLFNFKVDLLLTRVQMSSSSSSSSSSSGANVPGSNAWEHQGIKVHLQ